MAASLNNERFELQHCYELYEKGRSRSFSDSASLSALVNVLAMAFCQPPRTAVVDSIRLVYQERSEIWDSKKLFDQALSFLNLRLLPISKIIEVMGMTCSTSSS
jgi:hypothetical protein